MKRIGPITEPCGTPQTKWTADDLAEPRRTCWVLPSRYDRKHCKTEPCMVSACSMWMMTARYLDGSSGEAPSSRLNAHYLPSYRLIW